MAGPAARPHRAYSSPGRGAERPALSHEPAAQPENAVLALIVIPCLVLFIAIGIALSTLLDPPDVQPVKELTAKEVAAKMLPNMDKDIKLNSNPDVQVVEVTVSHTGGTHLVGVVKNMTAHPIAAIDLIIDLTNGTGSQVGAVKGTVEKLAPSSTKDFQFPIKQNDATFALVREIISR